MKSEILKICTERNINTLSELIEICDTTTLLNIFKNLQPGSTLKELYIFSDGNCKRNGSSNSKAGYSIFFDDEIFHKYSKTEYLSGEQHTNNKAELTGVLEIFKILYEYKVDFIGLNIFICTDSMYTIKCINEWSKKWILNGWKSTNNQEVKNKGLIEEILYFKTKIEKDLTLKFKYVASHKPEPEIVSTLEHKLWKGNKYVDEEINKLLCL